MGKSFLVICSGLYVELANALSEGGKNKVYYLTVNSSPFPRYVEYAPGHQFEFLEKVRLIDVAKYAALADGIVTFDTGTNGLITLLKKMYPEKCVFGAGVGEKLETDRIAFKRVLEAVDLRGPDRPPHFATLVGLALLPRGVLLETPDQAERFPFLEVLRFPDADSLVRLPPGWISGCAGEIVDAIRAAA